MRATWLLATRSWSASPGRTIACAVSVALGVCIVVAITALYETARDAIVREVVTRWLGSADVLDADTLMGRDRFFSRDPFGNRLEFMTLPDGNAE